MQRHLAKNRDSCMSFLFCLWQILTKIKMYLNLSSSIPTSTSLHSVSRLMAFRNCILFLCTNDLKPTVSVLLNALLRYTFHAGVDGILPVARMAAEWWCQWSEGRQFKLDSVFKCPWAKCRTPRGSWGRCVSACVPVFTVSRWHTAAHSLPPVFGCVWRGNAEF